MYGFKFKRQKGSHRSYVKKNHPRPVVIPTHGEVAVGIIKNNMKTADMDRNTFFELLKKCK